MNCIFPPELEDKKLLAYLDGNIDQETKLHLEQCQYCLEKAKDIARIHNLITAHLYRIHCPSSLELGEYHLDHLGLLSKAQTDSIKQHLNVCPHCEREIAELHSHQEELVTDLGPTLLRRLIVYIEDWLGRFQMWVKQWFGKKRESRSLDNQTYAPSLVALRGEEKTIRVDGLEITFMYKPAPERRKTILGQLHVKDLDYWLGASVEVYQDEQMESSASVDSSAQFRCEAVTSGSKTLLVKPKTGPARGPASFEVPA